MQLKNSVYLGLASVSLLAMALPSQGAMAFNQNVTPNILFGEGNANGFFTVDKDNGVELGLRAKIRYQGVYNSDGAGTYSFLPTDNWNVEWSINSDYEGTTGTKLSGLTYVLTGYFYGSNVAYDPVNVLIADHGIGDNSTANGAGDNDGARTPVSYASLIAANNVAQNSWRSLMYAPGSYVYTLEAFKEGNLVASTSITVEVAPVPEPTTVLAGALLLIPFGVSAMRRLRKS